MFINLLKLLLLNRYLLSLNFCGSNGLNDLLNESLIMNCSSFPSFFVFFLPEKVNIPGSL